MKTAFKTVSAACLLAMAGSAQSQVLWDTLVPNTLNFYEDQSRESIFDVDGSGDLTEGDVFIGWVSLDDRSLPLPGEDVSNDLYGIFSIQVDEITSTASGYEIEYKATDVAGLTLNDFNVTQADGSTMAAIYEDVGEDFVTQLPGDQDGDGRQTIFDYMLAITDDTYDGTAGLESAEDHWRAVITSTGPADPIASLELLESATLSGGLPETTIDFHAGLGILDVSGASPYAEDCLPTQPPGNANNCFSRQVLDTTDGPSFHELTVENGTVSGAADLNFAGAGNPYFSGSGNIAQGGGQLLGYNFYGVSDNADFGLFPATGVPEPSTLALMGLGMFGIGAARRRRKA